MAHCRLKELIHSSTWFKDHKPDSELLGEHHIVISEEEEQQFMMQVYRPYIQSVIDRISSRLKSSDLVSAFSNFDPRHLPGEEEELYMYGVETLQKRTDFDGKEQRVTYEDRTGVSYHCRASRSRMEYISESCLSSLGVLL